MDLENRIKELHNNVRHVTQLGMGWFAFLATANYLTMGWLATDVRMPDNRYMILSVAIAFIVQDCLGIFGLCGVIRSATAMKVEIDKLENPKEEPQCIPARKLLYFRRFKKQQTRLETTPIGLYKLIGCFLISVLVSLIYIWARIWFRY